MDGVPFQLGCGGHWGEILIYAWVRGGKIRPGIPKGLWQEFLCQNELGLGSLFPLFQLPDDLHLTSKSVVRPPFPGAAGPRGDLCKLATL